MQSVKLKYLNKLTVLKTIDRELLRRFLEGFEEHFEANGLTLPPPDSADGEFYAGAARLLRLPERLCPELNDALLAMDELASAHSVAALSTREEWKAVFRLPEAGSAETAERPQASNINDQGNFKIQEPTGKP